jgi:hypothetical protein
VLLDNSSTHEGEPLQKLLRQHPRLLIEHFAPTPRNSTPMKQSGRWPNDNSQTVGPMTSTNSWRMSSGQWRAFEVHPQSYAAASSNQNSLFFVLAIALFDVSSICVKKRQRIALETGRLNSL